jgi:hypothetical protein
MSRTYQSRPLHARVIRVTWLLLRSVYAGCVGMSGTFGGVMPPPVVSDDPRLDGDLVGWAIEEVTASYRDCRRQEPDADPRAWN